MRAIIQSDIDKLMHKASHSDRKREILRLHEHEDRVQRMVNAIYPGSYIRPHKHENPDKVELFYLLRGQVVVIQFSEIGEIEQVLLMGGESPIQIIEIPPRKYHSLIALQPSALLEIIDGPYIAETHKQFAEWSPEEDSAKARDYLIYMTSVIDNWAIQQE